VPRLTGSRQNANGSPNQYAETRYAINDFCTLYDSRRCVIESPTPMQSILAMNKSIIFVSALFVVAMMLASCESMLNSLNPFAPETTTTSTSGPPVTDQTNRATYEMPLGRNSNYVPADY
jgi:hypothetical protein